MYNWPNVAARTAAVYDAVSAAPTPTSQREQLLGRLRRYRTIGTWAGLIFCSIVVWLHWFWALLEWQQPAAAVDVAVDWPAMQDSSTGETEEDLEGRPVGRQRVQGGKVTGQEEEREVVGMEDEREQWLKPGKAEGMHRRARRVA